MTNTSTVWRLPGAEYHFPPPPQSKPLIMGIINTTPDSFSDGGSVADARAAAARALALVEEGADIIDIGGQSTRPGSDPVELDEELRRVVPAVQEIRAQSRVLISVDTSKAAVARRAIDAGAQILNDVTALREDPGMAELAARTDVGIIIMHMVGTPKTMQQLATYRDVTGEVQTFLSHRLAELEACGVPRERVAIDPGIGFGKKLQHNLTLVRELDRVASLGRPICLGPSRKGFIGDILGRTMDQRAVGTAAVVLAGYQRGAQILRVHDVAATRDAIMMTRAIDWAYPIPDNPAQ